MIEFYLPATGEDPAEYSAAIRASQLGLNVIVLEKDKIGETCLNRKSIPTKAFLRGQD